MELKNRVCIICGADDRPHYSKKRCKQCAIKSYGKPKQNTPLKRTALKKKPKKATGEGAMFKQIWLERPHSCINCKDYLGDEPLSHFFAHIISKKRRPDLRLDPENIMVLCFDCHYAYDFRGIEEFNKRNSNYNG